MGVLQTGFHISWDVYSLERGRWAKQKHTAISSSVGKNTLLIRKVREEWLDYMTTLLQSWWEVWRDTAPQKNFGSARLYGFLIFIHLVLVTESSSWLLTFICTVSCTALLHHLASFQSSAPPNKAVSGCIHTGRCMGESFITIKNFI